METHGPFSALLGALAGRGPGAAGAWSDAELAWLVRSGLGPLTWHLASRASLTVPAGWRERLHAADLVARVRMRELTTTTEWVVARLRERGIPSTVLKGMAIATRYYPEPHLRAMGDVDLLVPSAAIEPAVRLLRDDGFTPSTWAAPEWWDTHHHAPPLTHPGRAVTIELHRGLLPPTSAAVRDPAFDLAAIADRTRPALVGTEPVRVLVPEAELALMAAAWGNDLSEDEIKSQTKPWIYAHRLCQMNSLNPTCV